MLKYNIFKYIYIEFMHYCLCICVIISVIVGVYAHGCPTWWLGRMVPSELHGDAKVVINGEFIAGQHLRPGEAIGLHHRSTTVPHGLTKRAAGIDGPVQAHRCKQRAQEDLGISMAPFGQERHPAACLLLHFWHGLVIQEVGQPHLLVAHIVAQAQVSWYLHTLGLLSVEAAVVEVVRLPAVVVVLVCSRDGEEEEEEEGEGRQAQCQAEGALG